MPREPTLTPTATLWAPAGERHRVLWRAGVAAIVLVAAVLLAAWAVPPMLDWGRFRTRIAAIASARLGRPVVIGGEISLRLLPLAVLTANDVTLADPGDGISVQVSALRLQVATLPLLAGHLRLRELVLGAPVLRLPLSLPDGIAHPTRPQIPHLFAARIEGGTLRIGQTEITGITASVHGGPALASTTGSLQEALVPGGTPVAAFGAEGFASAAGRSWRFTTALGAPDADGVSAVDISVRGQGGVAETGGTLQATLADGIVQGRLRAGGPDLSLLMPASALAWHVDAPFVADAARIEANAVALSLGGAPADGALVLQLATPARLDGRLHAALLDLDGWAGLLGRTFGTPAAGPADVRPPMLPRPGEAHPARPPAMMPSPGLPSLGLPSPGLPRSDLPSTVLPHMAIDLSADAAGLLGGTLHDLHATLVSDGSRVGFDRPRAVLPGGAVLSASHASLSDSDAQGAPAPLAVVAPARLVAPDLRATLGWLRRLAPGVVDALPPGAARTASVSGDLVLRRTGLSVTGLHGHLDGSAVAGNLAVQLAPRVRVAATLAFDALAVDAWRIDPGLARLWTTRLWADAARQLAGPDIDLHLTARSAQWRGETFTDLALSAGMDAAGVVVREAHAALAGSSLALSGRLGADGSIEDVRASGSSPDLALLWPHLPAGWHLVRGLWHGPASLAFAAAGRPGALGLQLRADAADVVLEAEATRDIDAGTGPVTLTLRHPGAPRLLAALGLPAAFLPASAWLETGSATLRAHLQTAPGRVEVEDFDLDAAALRLSGALVADWSEDAPTLRGRIEAEQLALPGRWPTMGEIGWLEGWATELHLSAGRVLVGLRPVASELVADVDGAGTDMLADIAARAAGGQLTVQVAAGPGAAGPDAAEPGAAGSGAGGAGAAERGATDRGARGVAATIGWTGIEIASPLTGWPVDLAGGTADLQAAVQGTGMADASGTVRVSLQGTRVAGLGAAVGRSGAAPADLGGLSGLVEAHVAQGVLVIDAASLASDVAHLEVTGGANLVGRTVDLRVGGVHLSGGFDAVRAVADPVAQRGRRGRRK